METETRWNRGVEMTDEEPYNACNEVLALAQSDAKPDDPLPREHQDPSKWPSRETVERAHALVQSAAETQTSLWEARALLELWSEASSATKNSYELYKRTTDFLLTAFIRGAAPPCPNAPEIKFWQEEAAKWAKMFAYERRNHEFDERGWPRPDESAGPRKQLEEIERTTVRAGDPRMNTIVGTGASAMQSDAKNLRGCDMTTQGIGLVDQVQTTLKTFRASASVQGEPDFRELAVTIVRVFRDYIEAEIKKTDTYDTEQPGKGQGWE